MTTKQELARTLLQHAGQEKGELGALRQFLQDFSDSVTKLQDPGQLRHRDLLKHCFRLLYVVGRTFKVEHKEAGKVEKLFQRLFGTPEIAKRFAGLENSLVRAFSSQRGDIKKELKKIGSQEALLEHFLRNKKDAAPLRNDLQKELGDLQQELQRLAELVEGTIALLEQMEEPLRRRRAA